VGLAEAVATHRLLDRLIRGRLWIGVIAFALIGIVTMQLGLLKLNAGIGRSLEREALLQRENATLSTENSEMAAGERVEAQAEHMGMALIPSGALRFLAAHPGADASKAVVALSSSAPTATGSGATTPGTTATAESSSGTEPGATSLGASTETPGAGGESGSAPSSTTAGSTTSISTTGATAETGSPTSSSAATGAGTGSTGESGGGVSHQTEVTSPNNTSSGGAGETPSPSTSASTGGGTTPGG
jgi:hypothetical protein